MLNFNARDYGVIPEKDVTKELNFLLEKLNESDEEKILSFTPGTYYLNSADCKKRMLYITNCVGDDDFSPDETPHLNAVPFYFANVKNLKVEGNGAVFVIDGKVTNMAFEDCENIEAENVEIRHSHPDMHEFKVVRKTPFTVDFMLDGDTQYRVENGKLYFYGADYDYPADKKALTSGWIGLIREKTPDNVRRVLHPLAGSSKAREISPRVIRFNFANTFRFKKGDRFYFYDVRRQFAGIFVNRSKDIILKEIKQRFNYSLAFVGQDSENITIDSVDFAPEKGSKRMLASVADFMQICMCRGKFTTVNSNFDGAGDDCLNVHGIHFKIVEKNDDKITVRFMHPQSHGFNPLRAGDDIAFINPETLLETGSAKIISSEMINETDILLTLDSVQCAKVGEVIEDISACTDVYFANNTLNRIITRGLLLTTRGKVVIENNHFINNTMSAVLLSDDAKSWYESGMCEDVTVQNNIFDYSGCPPILIKPENSRHEGAVHRNIKILNNTFKKYPGHCVYAKSADSLLLSGNRFMRSKKIKTENCTNVTVQ